MTEVLGAAGSIIAITEAIPKVYGLIQKIQNLPQAFAVVGDDLKLALDILERIDERNHTEEDKQVVKDTLEHCERNARELQDVLDKFNANCTQKEDAKDWSKVKVFYKQVLGGKKALRVEHLMEVILGDLKKLALKKIFDIANQVETVANAIEELRNVDPSIEVSDLEAGGHHPTTNVAGNVNAVNNNVGDVHSTTHGGVWNGNVDKLYYDWGRTLSDHARDTRYNELESISVPTRACEWLFDRTEFEYWKSQTASNGQEIPILVLHGKPGSGKSVLLQRAFRRSRILEQEIEGQISLVFFFNAGDAYSRQLFYCSLLSQLLERTTPPQQAYERMKGLPPARKDWNATDLRNAFIQVLGCLKPTVVFLYLDALDQCQTDTKMEWESIHEFLEDLSRKCSHMRVHVCLTIRDPYHFGARLKATRKLDVGVHNEGDIEQYLDEKILYRDTFNLNNTNPDLNKRVRMLLSKQANGVFFWAKLAITNVGAVIRHGAVVEEIRKVIYETPQELHEVYKTLWEKTSLDSRNQTVTLFQLLLVKMRSLKWKEVRSAMESLETSDVHDSIGNLPLEAFRDRIHKLSGGLVEIRTTPSQSLSYHPGGRRTLVTVVDFIHRSVGDYLAGGEASGLDPKLFHQCVAELCIRNVGKNVGTGHASQGSSEENCFLPYAYQFWTLHTRKADQQGRNLSSMIEKNWKLSRTFGRCSGPASRLLAQLRAQVPGRRYDYPNKDDLPETSLLKPLLERDDAFLMLLASEGCTSLVAWHAENCKTCSKNQDSLETALYLAARRGWHETVKVVWKIAKSNGATINLHRSHMAHYFTTSLSAACYLGRTEVVQFLLEKTKIEPPQNNDDLAKGWPLHAAVLQRYPNIVRLLLEDSPDNAKQIIGCTDDNGWTAIHQAASTGDGEIFSLILDHLEENNLSHLLYKKCKEGFTARDIAEVEEKERKEKGRLAGSSIRQPDDFLSIIEMWDNATS
ncbi:nacht and ankyrin domain protein [Colletotrichum musicola]|uniref:Nacht and ankyrin domain protein n=1 Tax=Colletotrichum musicola TaxID=2175873 RepID=A0A8H6J441_9PEZI|nr:nacht and ankyrin domain protein [Colletotrichum musicola]